jgi:hypothetical protein
VRLKPKVGHRFDLEPKQGILLGVRGPQKKYQETDACDGDGKRYDPYEYAAAPRHID